MKSLNALYGLGLALPLLLSACASDGGIEEGKKIGEMSADKEQLEQAPVPVAKSGPVAANTERALENYQKLLDLPQDQASRAETMRRLADLQLEQEETNPGSFEQTEKRLRKSIELYNTLLTENPGAPGNDRILYQLSRAHQNLGENENAEAALDRMTREYPNSPYNDDAHFRRAELLFKISDFDKASIEYRYVLNRVKLDNPFFEPSQYKYGWAQYKLANYGPALDTFFAILDRELPPGELSDVKTAVDGVRAGKKDTVNDALRVISLSFSSLNGGESVRKYFESHSEPAYAPLIYRHLAETLLEKKRYTDAAKSYTTFVDAHPQHVLAPAFQSLAISAQSSGGFVELVVQEKERFVTAFDPAAPYWTGRAPSPDILKQLRSHLEDLSRHYQAKAQKSRDLGTATAKAEFLLACARYERLLALFPADPKAPELRFLMAESYLDAGDSLKAAKEYDTVAAKHPTYERAPEAAYAAVLAYQRYSAAVPDAQKKTAKQQSVQAALRLGDLYPQHPKADAVLTRAAEELYETESWDEAVKVATRVLHSTPPVTLELRRTALGVVADAQFSAKRYPEAEAAYLELLKITPAAAANRSELTERLASSIYKQGEAARSAKNPKAAAAAFLRVGQLVPDSTIRASSTYDGAAMLMAAKDWNQAASVLESFRTTFPTSPLLGDVDDKLAACYKSAGKLTESAAVQKRISARSNSAADKSDAAWQALTLLTQAKSPQLAAEYEGYLKQFPQPMDRAMEARNRLAELALARNDAKKREFWLQDIVAADAAAGAARTPRSQQLAAEASLEFARVDVRKVSGTPLKLPLKTSLPVRKAAMEKAIASLSKASDYGIADVTTAATYELGQLYRDFSTAILESDRPKKLSALEAEQYKLLLEEQAFPFEEKAIEIHESNLKRAGQGVTNQWVGRSLEALALLSPGKYGKREQTPEAYDALQ